MAKNPDKKLGDELLILVERDQGFAFISDGITVLSRAEIFDLARNSLRNTEKVARKLRKFLKKYGEATQ